ncbi:MAG TPA: hypothetical protein VHE09_00940 [Rhizomicrobium sp.]|jgi:hypothetical protein|nr:hypothetical protein [Rhizomicrobium sp.]
MAQAFAGPSTNVTTVSDSGVVHLGDNSGIGGVSLFGGGVNAVDSSGVVDSKVGGMTASSGSKTASNTLDSGTGTNAPGASAGTSSGGDNSGTGNNGGNGSESEIYNKQTNTDTVWNNTNVEVDNVNGDVNASAAATANAFQAVTFNNTVVNNDQYASGAAVGSDLNAQVTNINGSVNMSNIVACNTADVSTDPAYTVVNSKQECAVGDPSQATNVFVAQAQGDVNIAGSVAANVYTEDTNAKYNYVNTNQINSSAVNSTTNVQAYNIGGTVNVSSSAVGNTAQIIHY